MDALRQVNSTAWFKDDDAVWLKLMADAPVMEVIRPTDLQTSITIGC